MYNGLRFAELTIILVALIVLAIATAALRLIPTRWKLRSLPISERTWPAFGVTLAFVAIWFSQSVMPYRFPGAVDGVRWPILQVLHVEKRGMQFHEICVRVWATGAIQNPSRFPGMTAGYSDIDLEKITLRVVSLSL